jgi:hypothetical protein
METDRQTDRQAPRAGMKRQARMAEVNFINSFITILLFLPSLNIVAENKIILEERNIGHRYKTKFA